MKRLILIDSHAIIHRAYHALPTLTTPQGEPCNAVYGFSSILLRILRDLKPDYIAAAFDLPGPTFRHAAYERYKAHRPETPGDLAGQFGKTEELLEAFGIPVFKKEGYEADDIIGTISEKFRKTKTLEIIIVTGDMDALQLVRPGLKVYAMKKGITETVIYDEAGVKERYGLTPAQLVDYKGLRGDPSDNIPGVRGIGEKTAAELIRNFKSIDGVYKALKKRDKKISEGVAAKLAAGAEEAKFSRELSEINKSAPIDFKLSDLEAKDGARKKEIINIFQKFGFFSLIKRLGGHSGSAETGAAVSTPALMQGSLIGDIKVSPIKNIRSSADLHSFISGENLPGLILHAKNLYVVSVKGIAGAIDKKIFSEKNSRMIFGARRFCVHDGKSVIHFLRKYGIELGGIDFDLMIASWLTSFLGRDFSYSAIVARELGRESSEDVIGELPHFFEIKKILEEKIRSQNLEHVFREIELPSIIVLADMEERGVLIDKKLLFTLGKKTDDALEKYTEEIYKLAGEYFNINSTKQLSAILFEKMGIKTYGLKKTEKGGVISTRESELVKLKSAHPIIEKIMEYRELMKLKTTYIDVLPGLADSKDGRIRTTFNQTGTATGRLSSSDPNLQNIPVISEYGRKVRGAFIAEKGFTLVSADYSQVELRVAAHLADDRKMIEVFKKGMDIHKMTAAEIYNVPLEDVTPEYRRAAKTLNFGVLYGMGPQAFAAATGMDKDKAKEFITEYFKDFPGVRDFIAQTKRFAEENGYVETISGRRRYIPEIYSANWQLKREAERMAVNAPIQGSAADLVKMAMIQIYGWLKKEGLSSGVRLLLQVHDELVFETKNSLIASAVPNIKKVMENILKLKVPLVVDIKMGDSWNNQKIWGNPQK